MLTGSIQRGITHIKREKDINPESAVIFFTEGGILRSFVLHERTARVVKPRK
jgi:hypothetical protein